MARGERAVVLLLRAVDLVDLGERAGDRRCRAAVLVAWGARAVVLLLRAVDLVDRGERAGDLSCRAAVLVAWVERAGVLPLRAADLVAREVDAELAARLELLVALLLLPVLPLSLGIVIPIAY